MLWGVVVQVGKYITVYPLFMIMLAAKGHPGYLIVVGKSSTQYKGSSPYPMVQKNFPIIAKQTVAHSATSPSATERAAYSFVPRHELHRCKSWWVFTPL